MTENRLHRNLSPDEEIARSGILLTVGGYQRIATQKDSMNAPGGLLAVAG
jgi:hypothetical protein